MVLTINRHARRLAMVDFPSPVDAIVRMRIPKSFNARNPQARRDLATALRAKTHGVDGQRPAPQRERASREDPEITRLRKELRNHPCHECPDRESHARWAERYLKLDRDTQNLRNRIDRRTNTVARQFDRVCEVLDVLNYLDGDHVTTDGKRLQRLYSELDLLASECIRTGLWEGLDARELASVLTGLTFETRNSDDMPAPRYPRGRVRDVAERMIVLGADLERMEREHRLRYLRRPDFGFAQAAWDWASGSSLDEVLTDSAMAAGDFVRAIKQLIDVIAQVADAAGPSPLRTTARESLDLLRHGVVSYSSVHA
jgi:ATP-dependent RNA helicase HelY